MANINQVSFTDPYSVDQEKIKRQQLLAMQLQQQSDQALPGGQMAGGYYVPTSPLSHLAQALKGVNARNMMEKADADMKALGEARSTERSSTLAQALRTMQGTPASSETIMDETANGGEGQMAQINAPGMPANPRGGMEVLMQSRDPQLQNAGLAEILAQMRGAKPQEFTLKPGETRFGSDGKPIVNLPPAPVKPQNQSDLARLIQEREALPQNDPRRSIYDNAIRKNSEIAKQIVPNITVSGPKAKPPTGYRFSSDGETLEPIPGGPADKPDKPMPTAAVKLQQNELDAIGIASGINADLGAVEKQLEGGKLTLGPLKNIGNKALNVAGISTEGSRNLASFQATLERLRNDSLRLNKGVQTEGDAQRVWNELVSNINDPGVVKQRLGEIRKINERAVQLRKLNIENLRREYGQGPLDTKGYEGISPALGGTQPAGGFKILGTE